MTFKIMTWIAIILLLSLVNTNTAWTVKGNPIGRFLPCKENFKIIVEYEPGLPPGTENQYDVHIEENLPMHSEVQIKFDSEASVTLSKWSRASARIFSMNGIFSIRYFNNSKNLNFHVRGPASGTVPYLTSVDINTEEHCKKPDTGYLESYIMGYKDTAETHQTVPDDSCGRRKIQHTALITNGLPTKPGDWPWHAAIYRLQGANIKYICGGTLVAKNFILTAAHCASIRGLPVLPEILSVVLGKYNLIGGDVATQEREIHEVILHEEFTHNHLNNDIALLKLKTEAEYNDYVQPACLWYADVAKKLPAGQIFGTVVGWGFDHTDTLSSQLRQATVPIVSESTCIKSKPVFFGTMLNDRKFCAGLNNGTSACNGDSGGGFMVFAPDIARDTSSNSSGTWHVRGIVSLSVARREVALCDPNQYVLFTDVAPFRGWLMKHMK